MKYPLESGYYMFKMSGDIVYALEEDDGLIFCKLNGKTVAFIAEKFVENFEKYDPKQMKGEKE